MEKVYKRKESVKCKLMKNNKKITDKIWIACRCPKAEKDDPMKIRGRVLVSFEILPLKEAEKKPNGYGRSEPNMYPVLSAPTNRLPIDLGSPLLMLKELLGERLYSRIC